MPRAGYVGSCSKVELQHRRSRGALYDRRSPQSPWSPRCSL